MRILLSYRDDALGDAWRELFAGIDGVDVVPDDITTLDCDAIVSPANSFGFMDGGLDLALSECFNWHLEAELQRQIRSLDEGELLVGKALVIATGNEPVPWLIVAPTMRVPMSFGIATSVNAYLAMKAILIAARKHEHIETVAVPGLCTGVGRMPPKISAKQMFMAYREVVMGEKPTFAEFGQAQKHQIALNPDSLIWDF